MSYYESILPVVGARIHPSCFQDEHLGWEAIDFLLLLSGVVFQVVEEEVFHLAKYLLEF
jgi:hypothetical protein